MTTAKLPPGRDSHKPGSKFNSIIKQKVKLHSSLVSEEAPTSRAQVVARAAALRMQKDWLLELLAIAVRRPSAQCIFQRGQSQPFRSYTVTVRRWQQKQSSAPTSTSIPPKTLPQAKGIGPTANIPLHIGLDRNPEHVSAISRIPIPKGERDEKFVPSTLARPLGLSYPPRPGQNSPVETRTWAERRTEYVDEGNVLARRKILFRSFLRPYFQEWKRLDHYKGKSFVSNPRLFKRDKALYFPNMWGSTLSKTGDGPQGGRDTTPEFMGKVSVVGIQSGQWAEEQVNTFLGVKENPRLQEIIQSSEGLVQRGDINIQARWSRAMLVKLFKGRLRQMMPEEQWVRYFLVRLARDVGRGLTEDIQDAMGLLNSQVGYVYLLDDECRIRWAGSGPAWPGEVDSLNAGILRLVQEAKAGLAKPSSRSRGNAESEGQPVKPSPNPILDRAQAAAS